MANDKGASFFRVSGVFSAGLIAILGLCTTGWIACSKSNSNTKAKQAENVQATEHTPQPTGGGDVPWAITDLGELGESVYDAVHANNWTVAANKMSTLKAAAQAARGIPTKSADAKAIDVTKSLDEAVRELDTAIQSKNRRDALLKSNEVTMIAGELAQPFAPQVPLEVTRLDYDGRQMKIWSEARQSAQLKSTVQDMTATWDKLRPRVLKDGGSTQAKRFDRVVLLSQGANSLSQYLEVANSELSEVASLEQFFLRGSLNPNVPS